jgi:hypothetical protein
MGHAKPKRYLAYKQAGARTIEVTMAAAAISYVFFVCGHSLETNSKRELPCLSAIQSKYAVRAINYFTI